MATAVKILQATLDSPDPMRQDRAHSSIGPKSTDLLSPQDIVCQVHHYPVKERIVRRAWVAGTVKYTGTDSQILLDFSRATLQRWGLLWPLLQVLREKGIIYRWGYPFQERR